MWNPIRRKRPVRPPSNVLSDSLAGDETSELLPSDVVDPIEKPISGPGEGNPRSTLGWTPIRSVGRPSGTTCMRLP